MPRRWLPDADAQEVPMDPIAERIELPAGYGTATTTTDWSAVRERLEQAPRYWLVTLRPDGRAHVVPVDGVWLDDAWWYGGSPATLHQRNLERDQRVVVHLEDAMAAVILEGTMRRVTPPAELTSRLMAASKAKYGYGPPPEAYAAGIWALYPERARAWSAFPTDVTRFRFG
jgi:Pyridoxamine 5'-phosphate oxidase